MTIPASITIATVALSRTYSGDAATSRFSGTAAGVTRTIDIIQALPNGKGRWRHVVRCTILGVADVNNVRPSSAYTLTMDAPSELSPTGVADGLRDFWDGLNPLLDEVAAGEQ